MTVIIIIVSAWCIFKILNAIGSKVREEKRQKEIERVKDEQRRVREWQIEQERINREAARQRAEHDKAIAKAQREREILQKEQERQAAQLAKHEEEIEKLKFTVQQSESDIEFFEARIAELDYQLDFLLMKQSATTAGSAEFEKYQNKIVSLHGQIHNAEAKLSKARYSKAQAERKLG